MNLINRARNLLLNPKMEWLTIKAERTSAAGLLIEYVLPLSILPAMVALLTALLWTNITHGLISATIAIISAIVSFYVGTYVTDALAPSFSSDKDLSRSAQLVGYSYTANAVATILAIIPVLGVLAVLAGFVYSVYLMFLGSSPLKNTPQEKRAGYVIVIILVQVVLYFILTSVLTALILPGLRFY
jgi:beta-lactamase regulating signal transducer with metallopeptidase domain